MSIVGPNIRAGTTIGSVTNSSTVVLSTPATGAGTFAILGRNGQYSDGGATSGSKVYTSPTAIFTSGLVGKSIVGTDIPAGSTVSSVTNSSTVVLSNPAIGTGAGLTFTVFDRSGVLIHVASGALTLAADNFGPSTSGPDAGVTIWMGAGAAGITVTNSATVNGIIYAPNGTLSVSGSLFPNVNLTAGAVDVKAINLAANTILTLS